MKIAHFSLTQVRPGAFCIRQTSTEFAPGPSGFENHVIRVIDIPDGIDGATIARRLSFLIDPHDPPAVVSWSELETTDSEAGG